MSRLDDLLKRAEATLAQDPPVVRRVDVYERHCGNPACQCQSMTDEEDENGRWVRTEDAVDLMTRLHATTALADDLLWTLREHDRIWRSHRTDYDADVSERGWRGERTLDSLRWDLERALGQREKEREDG